MLVFSCPYVLLREILPLILIMIRTKLVIIRPVEAWKNTVYPYLLVINPPRWSVLLALEIARW